MKNITAFKIVQSIPMNIGHGMDIFTQKFDGVLFATREAALNALHAEGFRFGTGMVVDAYAKADSIENLDVESTEFQLLENDEYKAFDAARQKERAEKLSKLADVAPEKEVYANMLPETPQLWLDSSLNPRHS